MMYFPVATPPTDESEKPPWEYGKVSEDPVHSAEGLERVRGSCSSEVREVLQPQGGRVCQ